MAIRFKNGSFYYNPVHVERAKAAGFIIGQNVKVDNGLHNLHRVFVKDRGDMNYKIPINAAYYNFAYSRRHNEAVLFFDADKNFLGEIETDYCNTPYELQTVCEEAGLVSLN